MKKELKAYFKKHSSIKIKPRELAKKLNAREPHLYAKLKDALFKLYQEGYLDREGKRYSLHNENPQTNFTGVIQIIDDGKYGFVTLANQDFRDIFIAERNLKNSLNGDIVEIEIFDKQRGKSKEGKIVKVIERKHKEIVGTVVKSNNTIFVIPDQSDLHRDIFIPKESAKGAKNNDKVLVGSIEWEDNATNPTGAIIDN